MKRLNGLLLTKWEKEEIMDLLEDYPDFFETDSDKLNEISKDLYREAQSYIDIAFSIENKADTIRTYLKAIGEERV